MHRINDAAAHALNALTPGEAYVFDEAVATDEYLAEHLDSFRRVATELADGLPDIVPAASPEIWERIVAETGIETIAPPEIAPVVPIHRKRGGVMMSVAAVAAALTIGVATGTVIADSAQTARDQAITAASAGSTTIEMTNPVGMSGITASAVIEADGNGFLLGEALPALDQDRTYQLWVIVDGQVISAGLLGNNPDVVQFRAEGNIEGMAISNEVAGGVVVSEADPVALWLRDA